MRPLMLIVVVLITAYANAQPAGNVTSKDPNKSTSTVTTIDLSAAEEQDVSGRQNNRCYSTQFRCSNGQCISKTLLCNRRRDCRDGSDESDAICYTPELPTTESSYYPLENQDIKTTKQPKFECQVGVEFECTTGECVDQQLICDGHEDCRDGSDEGASICPNRPGGNRPSQQCRGDQFRCKNGECIAVENMCDGSQDCSDNSDEDWNTCQPPSHRPEQEGESGTNSWQIKKLRPCNVPAQPQNGRWRLHRSLCDSGLECSPPSNVRSMDPGSYLVYNCNPGFELKGNRDVLCGPGGQWVHEPKCQEIRCPDLSSSATEAFCLWNNVAVSCEVPAPVGTTGQLKCREGFVQEVSYTERSKNVTCQTDGKWSPKPIMCVRKPKKVKLVLEGDMIVMD